MLGLHAQRGVLRPYADPELAIDRGVNRRGHLGVPGVVLVSGSGREGRSAPFLKIMNNLTRNHRAMIVLFCLCVLAVGTAAGLAGTPPPDTSEGPTGALSRQEAVQWGLERNPELAALRPGLGPADGPQRPPPDARQPHDAVAAGQPALVLRQ